MPIIGTKLLDLVRTIERPGSYCVGGLRDVVMPSIDVAGVGRIGFPVSTEQAAQLIGTAEAAPYGRGQETLVDRDVRRTWQVDTQKVTIGGRRWDKTLAELVAETAQALGVDDPVEAEFYKLLVYDAGS
ncbi:MAG: 2OG-Fe(II) oxygenase, partial [Proteobacteria bacterium]|nr:2OG-Fe(II) oxygenase [Pseudomonadota bacterium]